MEKVNKMAHGALHYLIGVCDLLYLEFSYLMDSIFNWTANVFIIIVLAKCLEMNK